MVGGHGVAKQHQGGGIFDVGRCGQIEFEVVKIRRPLDISRSVVPFEGFTFGGVELTPEVIPIENPAVLFSVKCLFDVLVDEAIDFIVREGMLEPKGGQKQVG